LLHTYNALLVVSAEYSNFPFQGGGLLHAFNGNVKAALKNSFPELTFSAAASLRKKKEGKINQND